MPWCPTCGDEFRPGIERCPDCAELLTGEQPPPKGATRRPPQVLPEVEFGPDDDTVELAWLGPTEADLLAGVLRASGIPAMTVGVSPFAGEGGAALRFAEGAHVLVRRRDVDTARAVMDRPDDAPLSDEELAAQAAAAAGTEFDDGAVV
jgi:hypothetical protein